MLHCREIYLVGCFFFILRPCIFNVLVFTCLFILFALEKLKNLRKKSQIWYHSTQNTKNGLEKIIGTLNLIFGSTPFGKNYWDQSLPLTINSLFTNLYWNFGPLFFCQQLQVSQISRVPSAVLRSLHRCSMGFRSGLIAGHFRTLQRFV